MPDAYAEVIAVEVEQAEGAPSMYGTKLPCRDVAHGELSAELDDIEVLVAHLAQRRVAGDQRKVSR